MAEARADGGVVIGRFQPFHNGHLRLVHRAMDVGERCIVVLGSSQESRTERNPFTVDERRAMIEAGLDRAVRDRLRFVPVADLGDEPRWARNVEDLVTQLLADEIDRQPSIRLVGAFKDDSSDYLRAFPRWPLVHVPPEPAVGGMLHATDLRTRLFGSLDRLDDRPSDDDVLRLTSLVPAGTLEYLRGWRVDQGRPEWDWPESV
ncbi:MAG: adenylyltransferase/cytidyltransferase family protein [Actinomycetota bacterium]|nr:adenylyltransferase/cytidyltransferase family protein [Actinomycetota bacterium]